MEVASAKFFFDTFSTAYEKPFGRNGSSAHLRVHSFTFAANISTGAALNRRRRGHVGIEGY
jgi:hypothetical protein